MISMTFWGAHDSYGQSWGFWKVWRKMIMIMVDQHFCLFVCFLVVRAGAGVGAFCHLDSLCGLRISSVNQKWLLRHYTIFRIIWGSPILVHPNHSPCHSIQKKRMVQWANASVATHTHRDKSHDMNFFLFVHYPLSHPQCTIAYVAAATPKVSSFVACKGGESLPSTRRVTTPRLKSSTEAKWLTDSRPATFELLIFQFPPH